MVAAIALPGYGAPYGCAIRDRIVCRHRRAGVIALADVLRLDQTVQYTSVAATCMALATVFTALVEPKLAGRKFSRRELLLGLAGTSRRGTGGWRRAVRGHRNGILVGAISAFFVALFSSSTSAWSNTEIP